MGYIKPSGEFFDFILQDLGCNAKDCLMIGDSITNDMLGAKEAGMDVCYYNIKKKKVNVEFKTDYEIHSISELLDMLR